LADSDYKNLIDQGAGWSIQQGYGFERDLDHMESNGFISGGDVQVVSDLAKNRGRNQLGSIGSGNHFVEIGEVQQLFLPEIAQAWGVEKGMIYILIHSGSRGFGHQLCQDSLDEFKGATRAFGPGSKELSPLFQSTGQPVLVPGDMGRASHLMVGCGHPLTWCSSCHGAGRARSRVQSLKAWSHQDLAHYMHTQGVEIKATSYRTIAEEMPDAYKDVDQVVQAVQEAGLAKRVARLKPHMVIKG
jgi:RNA-splicing ligase RtcB